jgi:hypothetical protein
MNLYIAIENNEPINHPYNEDNLLMVYPGIDLDNSPNFCKFTRVERPVPKWDEVVEGPEYKIIDGICYDVWTVNKISDEEKQQMLANLATQKPYMSWTVDSDNYCFVPHTPYPESGDWEWDEPTLSWIPYVEPEVTE